MYIDSCVAIKFELSIISKHTATNKIFKSIRDISSAFNNVSTATDYNFKATELKVNVLMTVQKIPPAPPTS